MLARERGYEFERVTALVLERYFGFKLAASRLNLVGGGDSGLDFTGKWPISSSSASGEGLDVGVQCKHMSTQIAVSTVRELESSIRRMHAGEERIGILASCTPMSLAAKTWFEESDSILFGVLINTEYQTPLEFSMNPTAKTRFKHSITVRRQPKHGGLFHDIILAKRDLTTWDKREPVPKYVIFT